MFTLLKPKNRTLLGIDIGSTSIKVLQIATSGAQNRVEGYASLPLPQNAVEANTIKDLDAVTDTLSKALVQGAFTCKQVAISVPDSSAISKIIQINQGLNETEIEEIILMEADKYIPYPIDEINLDFSVIGPSTKNTAMTDVLIVASRTENVNNRIEAVKRAGLEPLIVDVESYAIERCAQLFTTELPSGGTNKLVALIDIGGMYTNLFVMHGLKVIFSREEEFGGKQLIDAMMQHYKIKMEEAIRMLEQGPMPEDFQTTVLRPFQEQILLQVKRGLQFFFSTSQYTYVDYVLVGGGVAKNPEFATILQESINIPTSIANPFKHMTLAKSVNHARINKDAPGLLLACGLALRTA